MRDVLKKAAVGDLRAKLAVETFCYRIRKYIGSYLAALNGADAIIFTGGIGENSPEIRSRVCNGLTSLGISLDADANAEKSDKARRIGPRPGSPDIPVWVVPTQEELLIARDTVRCIVPA
jgi:acetate kinase